MGVLWGCCRVFSSVWGRIKCVVAGVGTTLTGCVGARHAGVSNCQDMRTRSKAQITLSALPPGNLSNLRQQVESCRSNARLGRAAHDPEARIGAVGCGRGELPVGSSEATATSTLAQHHTCADTHESGRPARASGIISGIIPLKCTLMTPRSQPPRNGFEKEKSACMQPLPLQLFFLRDERERASEIRGRRD